LTHQDFGLNRRSATGVSIDGRRALKTHAAGNLKGRDLASLDLLSAFCRPARKLTGDILPQMRNASSTRPRLQLTCLTNQKSAANPQWLEELEKDAAPSSNALFWRQDEHQSEQR
jgi:hypothetical protein